MFRLGKGSLVRSPRLVSVAVALLLESLLSTSVVQASNMEHLLECRSIPPGLFIGIEIVRESGDLKSRVLAQDGNHYDEALSEIEWAQGDLTLPNYENNAYRLIFAEEPNIWRLVQYSIEGGQQYWNLQCQKPTFKAGQR